MFGSAVGMDDDPAEEAFKALLAIFFASGHIYDIHFVVA